MINYQSVGREYDFETLVFLYGGRLQNTPTQHTLKVINYQSVGREYDFETFWAAS
ncbi:hypothetical protein HMPREF9073_02750 [Capnocytophaga sp. oral taxon 326 str. F0382]|nr:hypothetical protein HMPREF9073_02750 [Capnocytophaga sp. oral taxon 326 str. F0382]